MARRRTPRRHRWIAWSPAYAEIFTLAAEGWRPPSHVRVSAGRSRSTLSARYTRGDGAIMTVRVRLVREPATGEFYVTAEEVELPVLRVAGAGR